MVPFPDGQGYLESVAWYETLRLLVGTIGAIASALAVEGSTDAKRRLIAMI